VDRESGATGRPTGGAVTAAVAVFALLGVAAWGATSSGSRVTISAGTARGGAGWALSLFAVLLAASGGVVLWGFRPSRRRPAEDEPAPPPPPDVTWRDRAALALVGVLIAGVVAAIVFAVRSTEPSHPTAPATTPSTVHAPNRPSQARPTTNGGSGGVSWHPIAIAGGLVGLIVVLGGAQLRHRRRRLPFQHHATGEADDASRPDESPDALLTIADPRAAVIRAYAGMERALAGAGMPPKRWEAPYEYLARVRARYEGAEPSVRRLTELFERAKFAHHTVPVSAKAAAIDAMRTVQSITRPVEGDAWR
jgi:hypothetical protein